MTPIYHADNAIEAHLVLDLLAVAGFTAHIAGTDLLGAIGELPALGMVRVWVEDARAEEARELVADWANAPIPDDATLQALADGEPDSVLIQA